MVFGGAILPDTLIKLTVSPTSRWTFIAPREILPSSNHC